MSAQPSFVQRSGAESGAPPSPRLRVLPIPSIEPEPLTAHEFADLIEVDRRSRTGYQQIALAVDFTPGDFDPLFAPQATSSTDLPDAAQWSRQVLRVMLEIMDGTRPARQLSRWVSAPIHDRVSRRGIAARRRGGRAPRPNVVASSHASSPRDGVAEVSALVIHNGRYRAVALQLTGTDGRWLMTAFEIG